jgi:hypothetical protein
MSDPIEDLENFNTQGLNVNPLPASEVRRRGNRMRRRNNALATIGGVAAVAIIAVPLALSATGSDRAGDIPPAGSPPPSPSTGQSAGTEWVQTIPPDFPLTEGMPKTNGIDGTAVTVTDEPGVRDIVLCDQPGWTPEGPVASVAVAGATYTGETEDTQARTLALYSSSDEAQAALETLRTAVVGCPSDPNGTGAPLVYDLVEADLGAEASLVFTEQARTDADLLSDLTVYQVARKGNALYVANSHTSAGGPQVVAAEVDRLASLSAPVISDLCLFAAEPCGPTDGDPSKGEGSGGPTG